MNSVKFHLQCWVQSLSSVLTRFRALKIDPDPQCRLLEPFVISSRFLNVNKRVDKVDLKLNIFTKFEQGFRRLAF